jgi:hypothetical protein
VLGATLIPPPTPRYYLVCMAPLTNKDNTDFWKNLAVIGSEYSGPWLCIVDFNRILDQSEKSGGRVVGPMLVLQMTDFEVS